MKLAFLFSAIALALFACDSQAQFIPPLGLMPPIMPPLFPPFMPPFFGGVFPRFFGFPFFGMGGFGFGRGFGGGFGRGGFGGGFGRGRGRRLADETTMNTTAWAAIEKPTCTFEAANSTIKCTSPVETFECATEVRLEELKDLTIRLPNLNIVPETTTYKTELVDILRLYSRTTESKWTFVTPSTGKEVTLSVFSTSELTASGFYVKDTTCWAKIVSLVKSVPTRFSIVYKA